MRRLIITRINFGFMICPHCLVAFSPEFHRWSIGVDADGNWNILVLLCPECKKLAMFLENDESRPFDKIGVTLAGQFPMENAKLQLVRPKGSLRPPCPLEVPKDIKNDYQQACLVLPDSPEASAALSRRCLQHILFEQGYESKDLRDQISQILDSNTLPPYIAEDIDAIRNIGNIAAHPQKTMTSEELVSVELKEAEWNLNIIEALFDHLYVQREKAKQRRDALNQKLQQIGKPSMK